MAIQNWSDKITVVELGDDPQFSEDMANVTEQVSSTPTDVVLNFSAVGFINSSNIARLLRLRKLLLGAQRRLILNGVNSQVWGVLIVTGLDRIFEFTNDMATALAMLQLTPPRK
jgi:anti-anti-sigma factor